LEALGLGVNLGDNLGDNVWKLSGLGVNLGVSDHQSV
jgi:hypothetical protein